MLDARHLNLRHRNDGQDTTNVKLVAKKIGPFKIERMINQNVAKLTLPRAFIKLHPSFNIDLLSHFVPNPVRFSSRPVPKAVPVIDEATGDEWHIVEALVKKRMVSRQPEWLVRWHGLPEHESTWEKEKKHPTRATLARFSARLPNAPTRTPHGEDVAQALASE